MDNNIETPTFEVILGESDNPGGTVVVSGGPGQGNEDMPVV